MALVSTLLVITTLLLTTIARGQNVPGFSLRGQSYPNNGLVLISDIGETTTPGQNPNNGLNCVSDLTTCCSSGSPSRGEFDFPDGSVVPTLGSIRNGYYRNRGADRIFLNRQANATAQGLFRCRIRTQNSPSEEFFIGVYDESTGLPTVSSVSVSGLSLNCVSSGGPATQVTWRRNCAVLPNNATFQQTQQVTQTQTAAYQNTLVIDSAVADRDGVYTCSVTNTRGYSNGVTGLGASYTPNLPVTVSITTSNSPVAGEDLVLTCDHGSTAMNPAYQWFDETGALIGSEATLSLSPLRESDTGEYSCLVTDQTRSLVGCGLTRVDVQAPTLIISVEGVANATAGAERTLTCSVNGVDITSSDVTSVMYTWLRDGSIVQAASTSNQYIISTGSVGVGNAGDMYTCQVSVTASYWDVSRVFEGTGSGTLTVSIPAPNIFFSRIPLVKAYYVGLNFSLQCDVTIPGAQLIGVEAVVDFMNTTSKIGSSSDGRVALGGLVETTLGRAYRRSLTFTPLSAGDMGDYQCSATVMPTIANPGVTNGVRIESNTLSVVVPTLEVVIDRNNVPSRIIDLPGFNGFMLTCTASSQVMGVPKAINKTIIWMRSVDGGPAETVSEVADMNHIVMISEDGLQRAVSTSVLVVNTTVSGRHLYACEAKLIVTPAPDDIRAQSQTNVTIVGPSPPVTPTELMAIDISHDSATISWTVPSLSYDPEMYTVEYGLTMDNLNLSSAVVTGTVTPLNYADSYQGSVKVEGLEMLTTYFYRVVSMNSAGPTLSAVASFNTSALAPEPPMSLLCAADANNPLSYTCNWLAPTVTNGVLTGYQLTCDPQLQGIQPATETSSMISTTVSNLKNGINYTCTVQARGEGGLSLPSAPVSFYTIEIAPTGPPIGVQFTARTSRVMEFTWSPPEPTQRNGMITGYSLTCSLSSNGNGQISRSYPPQESYTLSGFRPGTQYTCQVFAMNGAGIGPPAQTMPTSPEDTPDGPPLNIGFELTSPSEAMFSWSPPAEELRNGVIQSYRIACMDIAGVRDSVVRSVTASPGSVTSSLVTDFIPATRYNCSFSARTTVGFGVNATLVVLTMPDSPVIRQVLTETRSLLVTWAYTNPPLSGGTVIDGYRVYIDGSLDRTMASSATQLRVSGLTPFTNYTVEVSAFNTRIRDGDVQEGPRSDPITNMTLEGVPGSPVCPARWEVAGLSSLTVNWTTPTEPNGIITSYYVELLSFDNSQMIASTAVPELTRLRTVLSDFSLVAGSPYHVRVFAENGAGNGSFCTITDFGDEDAPSIDLARSISISRVGDGTTADFSWTVQPLDQVRGYVYFEITVRQDGGVAKRQSDDCTPAGCRVSYQMGGVTMRGLNPDEDVTFDIMPVNEEGEQGPVITKISQRTTPSTSPPPTDGFPLTYVIIAVAVVVVIAIVVVIVVVAIFVVRRRSKSSARIYSPKHMSATNTATELGELKKVDLGESELRMSHRSTSPLTPDLPPSPVASPELFEADRLQPIEIDYFSEHVKNMHENRDKRFEREYKTLPNDDRVPATAANKNKSKNRFANIFPYDFSRVKLKEIEGVDGTDYINASYIDGYGRPNAYIAAQGPMPTTIGDFWRMIWEHRLSTIVMLTKITEGGKRKCELYWPNSIHETYNPPETTLSVTFEEIQPFADYEIKKLVVTNTADPQSSPLTILHHHFLGWPDHGVPQFATSLIGFIRRVRSKYNKSGPPMLVHCSAGVGRTGTFIVLDSMLERLEKESTVNVYEFLTNMRRKRIEMVQTQAQYVFIHDALEELITCGDTSILSHNLRMRLANLGKIVAGKIITGFQDQFELLSSVSRQSTDKDHSDALQHYNSAKNRYQDKLPFNTNRARLRPTGTPGGDYVNASFIDGYKKRNGYIAAQAPLPNTVDDFWRMVWEFKSKCVVMLCDLMEGGQESCHVYWPQSVDSTVQYGKLMVTFKSEKEERDAGFIIRKFEISEDKTQSAFGSEKTGFMVTQFQFMGWPELGRPETSQGLLQMAESVNAVQRSTGNKAITVMCNDGVGRTGTFICIHAQLERVKSEGVIDIFQFVKSSRISRPNLVSELEYYIFCHHTLADFLDTFDTYANFKDLGAAIYELYIK